MCFKVFTVHAKYTVIFKAAFSIHRNLSKQAGRQRIEAQEIQLIPTCHRVASCRLTRLNYVVFA